MINSFSIFKNTRKEKETQPDYNMSAKVGDEFVDIGACWLKDGKSGKFFSCQLKKEYQDKKGYEIIEIGKDTTPEPKSPENAPQSRVGAVEYPTEDIKSEDIPF